MERAIMCPQCNAPLSPHRFARSVVCSYCGATVQLDESSVSATQFHNAFRAWNSPESYQIPAWFSIGQHHWALGKYLAQGDISDVYAGQRARWPTELVLLKLLRDRRNTEGFDNEWKVLEELQQSESAGADMFMTLLPQPIMHGDISAGSHIGTRVNIFRWAGGFHHTFEEVCQTYPHGIPPRASIWIWRRILEVLTFIHNSGMVHGAVLPSHLLVQENEHGVRLVGYSSAGHAGERLQVNAGRYASFYPQANTLSPQLDIIMSARCIVSLLGGNLQDGSLPATVPSRLAHLVQEVAHGDSSDSIRDDAWALHKELGILARDVFGSPQFIPIVMPS